MTMPIDEAETKKNDDDVECVHVSFHEQARKTPDAPCLVDASDEDGYGGGGGGGGGVLTYAAVQRRVLSLASELLEHLERQSQSTVCSDRIVAIYMEPSPDYVISMLAILTAGAAYCPLEMAYPTSMLQRVLGDATPVAVLTKLEHRALLPATAAVVLCLDDAEHQHHSSANIHPSSPRHPNQAVSPQHYSPDDWPRVTLDDLAFVVYSSGTTGQPKGIANPHRAPALSYRWRFDEVSDYKRGDVVACHVFFVWEALRPVMRGGAVMPVPASVVFDGELMSQMLCDRQVTEMLFTPSLLESMFNTLSADDLAARLASLKTIFLNGEVVSMKLRERCLRLLPRVRFVNLYSISECHEVAAVDLTEIDLSDDGLKFVPVGTPCSVSPAYVLDETTGLPVAAGEAGELFVGGEMLARGYLNLPDLTKTRFVPDPFAKDGDGSARLYRSGDRARFLPNGQLEILGRCDFMVKIRGYSIVLGAVEAALLETVALSSCVVIADGLDGDENKHLVAYLVRSVPDDATVDADNDGGGEDQRLANWHIDSRTGSCPEIRRAVDGVLPHYMVPTVYIEVETLPVNAVGAKLDRKALQAQSNDRRTMLRSLTLFSDTHTTAASAPPAETATTEAALRWTHLAKYLKIPSGSPAQDVEHAMETLWEVVLDREPGSLGRCDADFLELGGHSLSAARLAALINRVFGTKLTAVQFVRGCTLGAASRAVLASWNKEDASTKAEMIGREDSSIVSVIAPSSAAEQDSESGRSIIDRVREDAVLPEDVAYPHASSGKDPIPLSRAATILVTGATGFFGAHLLNEVLLKNPSATVLCLVRSGDKDAVSKNLKRFALGADCSRIVTLKGDLSLPMLGLSKGEWDRTVKSVDAIVHSGAAVSLTAPYDVLRPANVSGTLSIVRLACACKPGTSLFYVSSNGIFPTDKGDGEVFLENDDVGCLPDRLGPSNGYGLSKWAAERLVSAAHALGLPTMIIRFGNIGWQSKSGVFNPLDYQCMMLRGAHRLSMRPQVFGWKFEVTPADFAARSFVELAGETKLLSRGSIFNCVQNGFNTSEEVFWWLSEASRSPLASRSFDSWKERVQDAVSGGSDDELAGLLAFVSDLPGGSAYLAKHSHLDCSKFDAALASLTSNLTRPDPTVMRDYYGSFFKSQTLQVTPSLSPKSDIRAVPVDSAAVGQPGGPLAGKVAVITGASSGIGQAIVVALVGAGCDVAMGARRMTELEKTRELLSIQCAGSSSRTVIVSTDVTQREQVAGLVNAAEEHLGPVDILVNVAGCMYFTLMKNVIWDQWDAQVDVNAKGTMYGIGTVLPKMLDRGRGHIVNITSDAGRKAFPGLAVYSGSKFFVEGMTSALRAETASTGLRVTNIQPGNVKTPLLAKSTDPEGLKEYGEPTGAKVLEPADIGRAVVYAVTQPEWCAVNEILVEPREEPA